MGLCSNCHSLTWHGHDTAEDVQGVEAREEVEAAEAAQDSADREAFDHA